MKKALLVIMLVLNIGLSLIVTIIAKQYGIKNYYESFKGSVTLAENIELSDEFTIQLNGKPIFIPK